MNEHPDQNAATVRPIAGGIARWVFVAIVLVVLGVMATSHFMQPKAPTPGEGVNFDQALAQGRSESKPVMVIFTAWWCGPCQQMKRSVWPDPRVEQIISERFVPVAVDLSDREPNAIAERYQIEYIPTIVVVNGMGEPIDRIGGVGADQMYQFLQLVASR